MYQAALMQGGLASFWGAGFGQRQAKAGNPFGGEASHTHAPAFF